MSTIVLPQRSTAQSKAIPWLPLAGLIICAAWTTTGLAPWIRMWCVAIACFAGLKWLSLSAARARRVPSLGRTIGYLFLWPGLNANAFLTRRPSAKPSLRELGCGTLEAACGWALIYRVVPRLVHNFPLFAGWAGMAGIILVLHFGLFRMLSWAWRHMYLDAEPIMNWPLAAHSLTDFWGRRWNTAFRDVAHAFVFRPLVTRLGARGAMLATFLASGLIHDVVISLPVRSGYGLPTLYFVLQGFGVLIERSALGERLRLGRGVVGHAFTAAVVVAPVPLLFHRPFIEQAILPTLAVIGALRGG